MLKELFRETEQGGYELEDTSKANREDRLVEKIEEKRTQLFSQKHPVLKTAGNATFLFQAIAAVITVTEWKSPMTVLGKHVQCAM